MSDSSSSQRCWSAQRFLPERNIGDVHLWVEDFLELFTAIMAAYIFVPSSVVREAMATRSVRPAPASFSAPYRWA